jgi:hypothetical protein
LDEQSIVLETCQSKRGSSAAIAALAVTFMKKILLKNPSIEGLDGQVWRRRIENGQTAG